MRVLVLCRRVDNLDNAPSIWGRGWAPCWVGVGHFQEIMSQAYAVCREYNQRFDLAAYQFTVVVAEYDLI